MSSNVFSVELGTHLCSVRDVTITSASLVEPSPGITLTRWGLNNQGGTDWWHAIGPLARSGPFTANKITARCNTTDYYSRVGLELHRTEAGTQSFLGLRLTYQSAGRQKVAYLWENDVIREPSSH